MPSHRPHDLDLMEDVKSLKLSQAPRGQCRMYLENRAAPGVVSGLDAVDLLWSADFTFLPLPPYHCHVRACLDTAAIQARCTQLPCGLRRCTIAHSPHAALITSREVFGNRRRSLWYAWRAMGGSNRVWRSSMTSTGLAKMPFLVRTGHYWRLNPREGTVETTRASFEHHIQSLVEKLRLYEYVTAPKAGSCVARDVRVKTQRFDTLLVLGRRWHCLVFTHCAESRHDPQGALSASVLGS
ncbi:hypothetical protein M409DRAFT_52797 [Zasmidium cellare ATCC 36951]|uniref:Uncharacterized protein n=1 Tax=Zasmidium cellare ATCC 36951 TaxID=1080233 RepID=A0A6A6CQ27_ZASCE|nr:uncharacterized protein M409DRAFT_52797 [Zasmidium cellare ATCC 36951]KAF2168783.1 hypothetical protein M409DRAFT_52797 [Zasmidium cellare ATCC 36951]